MPGPRTMAFEVGGSSISSPGSTRVDDILDERGSNACLNSVIRIAAEHQNFETLKRSGNRQTELGLSTLQPKKRRRVIPPIWQ